MNFLDLGLIGENSDGSSRRNFKFKHVCAILGSIDPNLSIYFTEKFGTIVQNLRGQLATLSINENIEVVEMMTNALKRMRDNLANLEYEDLEEADPTVMDKDLEAAKAIIAEFSSDKDSATENSKDKIEL